jgi:UDP-glucose 4-epimerase
MMNVLEVARANKAHVVYSSSAAVYGDTEPHPKTEEGPFDPLSLYGSQKLFGELLLRNYGRIFGLTSVCLRYFNVYGPRQRPDSPYSGVISVFVDRGKQGLPITIHGDGMQTRDFVSVHDVVRANLAAAEARSCLGQAYNICRGEETTVRELAERVIEILGSKSELGFGPARAADILRSRGSHQLAMDELGFKADISFSSGISSLLTEIS